jgi:hypothetical protein
MVETDRHDDGAEDNGGAERAIDTVTPYVVRVLGSSNNQYKTLSANASSWVSPR